MMITFILFFAIVGIVLVIMELFLPGMVIGILGGIFMLVAIALTYVQFGMGPALLAFAGLFVLTLVIIFGGFRILPHTAIGKKIILSKSLFAAKSSDGFKDLMGAEGRALTMLRPAGKAEFDGKHYDVVAEVSFINEGQAIKVIGTEGLRIVVRAI